MLGDISVAENIYIACGYTDMRKSIDGLAAMVQQQFQMDPFNAALFLFVESGAIVLRHYFGKKMVLCFCISV
jgi:hypothetical protein